VYVAFPRSEYYQQVRLPSRRLLAFRCTSCPAYSDIAAKDHDGYPRFLTFPFRSVPCSQTPPRSPTASPLSAAYYCFPGVQTCQPSDVVVTWLYRFTFVTARMSLCLRLTHIVTSMSPRLDPWWSGSLLLAKMGISPIGNAKLRLAH
jgi:hypothetical protein